jgi:hypothetical protein
MCPKPGVEFGVTGHGDHRGVIEVADRVIVVDRRGARAAVPAFT